MLLSSVLLKGLEPKYDARLITNRYSALSSLVCSFAGGEHNRSAGVRRGNGVSQCTDNDLTLEVTYIQIPHSVSFSVACQILCAHMSEKSVLGNISEIGEWLDQTEKLPPSHRFLYVVEC